MPERLTEIHDSPKKLTSGQEEFINMVIKVWLQEAATSSKQTPQYFTLMENIDQMSDLLKNPKNYRFKITDIITPEGKETHSIGIYGKNESNS